MELTILKGNPTSTETRALELALTELRERQHARRADSTDLWGTPRAPYLTQTVFNPNAYRHVAY